MQPSKGLRALSQRQSQLRLLHLRATEHSAWLTHLATKYTRPRAELVTLFDATPGALEREIAQLISDAALAKARELRAAREWPDDSAVDLFDRAVYGHWRRLRDAEMDAHQPQIAELKSQLKD